MPNKVVTLFCAAIAVAGTLPVAGCSQLGKLRLPTVNPKQALASIGRSPKVAHNVILFVGEGMGVSTVTAAHILEGQLAAQSDGPAQTKDEADKGEANLLSFERFTATALAKTYNTDLQVGESAGAMTAMMTGKKTRGAAVAVDADQDPALCQPAPPPKAARSKPAAPTNAQPPLKGQLATLLEEAKDAGLSVGLVTTGRVTQSVPAATYAHASDRDWEIDSQMTADQLKAGCRDIARQLVDFDHHGGLDVVLGGGRQAFLPAQGGDDPAGLRQDGRNLIDAWRHNPNNRTALYVANAVQLGNANPKSDLPLLGLFAPDRLGLGDAVAARQRGDEEPSLSDMTLKAIRALSNNRRGYVLVVDAAGIAAAHQAGNAHGALMETIELSKAVDLARQRTDPRTTLIIVTADQGSPLTIAGYPKRGNPILGLAPGADALGRPYTTLGYANGPGGFPPGPSETAAAPTPAAAQPAAQAVTPADSGDWPTIDGRPLLVEPSPWRTSPRPLLTEAVAEDRDYVQAATVPLPFATHSGEAAPVYATGPGSQAVHGVMEQEGIYRAMVAALPPVSKVAKAAAATAAKSARSAAKAAAKAPKSKAA